MGVLRVTGFVILLPVAEGFYFSREKVLAWALCLSSNGCYSPLSEFSGSSFLKLGSYERFKDYLCPSSFFDGEDSEIQSGRETWLRPQSS